MIRVNSTVDIHPSEPERYRIQIKTFNWSKRVCSNRSAWWKLDGHVYQNIAGNRFIKEKPSNVHVWIVLTYWKYLTNDAKMQEFW